MSTGSDQLPLSQPSSTQNDEEPDQADPRAEFLRTLLLALGKKGPVLVWNAGFESGVLKGLVDIMPKWAAQINGIIQRVVDLLPLARKHYYHRDMHGSWSIKSVLPTIAPELHYDDLHIGDGVAASQAFTDILLHLDPLNEVESKRRSLLDYCERDTVAMVRFARKLTN